MLLHMLVHMLAGAQAAFDSPANPQLAGVNTEFVNPLGLFVGVNRDAHGRPGSWLPPNLKSWVNASDPLNSAALTELLGGLRLGSYRYPGGSIGNYWNWTSDSFSPLANNSFYSTIAAVERAGFPPGVFGVRHFDEMLRRSGGAANILMLDVCTAGPDPSVPARVIRQLGGLVRAPRFEIGNEVYDPRQGPQPGGYATAQEYLADTHELVEAVRDVGASAGVSIGPCPFLYPEGSDCWGGAAGRYHQWHRNLSSACQQTSGGACPFDAVVVHNYVVKAAVLAPYTPAEHLSVFLAVPQVTVDHGAASMARDFADEVKLWITEFNVFYPSVWYGKADATARDAAAFLNSTENSPAHAVHVAAHIVAAMAHGDLIEMMNYHSFLEGVGPADLGPDSAGGSQPGFAAVGINASGSYISPVAQMLSTLARWLSAPNATMEGVPARHGSQVLPLTLAAAGLGSNPLPCTSSSAICGTPANRMLVINRCTTPVAVSLDTVCGGGVTGWASVLVYSASVSAGGPGRAWAKAEGPADSWGPMRPDESGAGTGALNAAPLALTVIQLQA